MIVLLLIALALIVGVVIVGRVIERRRAAPTAAIGRATSTASGTAMMHPWLDRAGVAAQDGLSAVRDLDEVGLRSPRTAANEPSFLGVSSRLDGVTHRLAELVSTAPTTMDERVCRNAAVRTRVFADALRDQPADGAVATGGTVPRGAELADRRDECEHALTDLAQHVLLI